VTAERVPTGTRAEHTGDKDAHSRRETGHSRHARKGSHFQNARKDEATAGSSAFEQSEMTCHSFLIDSTSAEYVFETASQKHDQFGGCELQTKGRS
jgi:hypothetical protein